MLEDTDHSPENSSLASPSMQAPRCKPLDRDAPNNALSGFETERNYVDFQ
jgi:hypothetical protein